MSNDEPRPGTTASVERHVEHLSDKVSQLETRVAAVELNLGHTRDLLGAQLKALESGQNAVLAKLEAVNVAIQASNVRAAEAMSDPLQTAAGRSVMAIITDMTSWRGEITRKVYMAMGAIGLIAFLAPLAVRFLFP